MLVAAPVCAEPLPNVLQSEMGRVNVRHSYQSLEQLTHCFIKHGSSDVAKFLAADYPPKHLDSGSDWLANNYDYCLRDTALLVLTPTYMRGALVEAQYHRAIKGEKVGSLGSLTDGTWSTNFAECVVAAQPVKAEALLATPIASPEQAAAIAGLEPDLSNCGRKANITRAMDQQLFRFEVAEVLYRRRSEGQHA